MKTLNIKDPEVHRLAAAIADETGQTMTLVVREALRERYERLHSERREATLEEVLAIARRISSRVKGPYKDHGDLLYDEMGLPK
jgi:antitoxin VapB